MLRPGMAAMLRPGPGTVALVPSEVAPAALHRLQSLGEQVQGLGDCWGSSSPPCQDVGSAIWKGGLVSLGTATPPAQGGQKQGKAETWHYAYILYCPDKGGQGLIAFFFFFLNVFCHFKYPPEKIWLTLSPWLHWPWTVFLVTCNLVY